ncbi:MAG: preprotein translocase subunit SecE [Pirellulales bacterium]
MAQDNTASWGSVFRELFHFGIYKRSQGKIARQTTAFALFALAAFGDYRLLVLLTSTVEQTWVRLAIGAGVLLAAAWICFRLVNAPKFADFLIAVEAEMSKVSWPSRTELIRSVIVVMITLFALTAILFAYDAIWSGVFRMLGIRI